MKNILLVCAFFLTLIITFDLFLKEPPVWPDEASLASMASISKGDLIEDYQHYPSFYIGALNILFHFTGISIEVQRAFSLFVGFICIITFCLLISKISESFLKNNFFKIIPVILLLTDFTFLQATRVGRPEIITLLFGILSVYLLFLFISQGFNRILFLILSFVFAVSSFAFHANGVIYVFTILITILVFFKKLSKLNQKIVILSTFFLIPFFVFLGLKIMPSLGSLLNRLMIANAQDTWLFTIFSSKPVELKLIYLSFIIITTIFLIFVVHQKKFSLIFIAIPLVLSWVILIINKDFWYAVYLVPFVYLSTLILLEATYIKWKETGLPLAKYKFFTLIFVCLVILLANLKFHIDILLAEGGNRYSYQQYVTDIQQIIPDGSSVFTSAIPDPYYAFVNRKNNKLTRFPQSFVEKGGYLKELNETDYIIYNGPYGSNYYGNIVMEYLQKNKLEIIQIGSPGQYQAIIAKLKPRNQRINP